LKKPFVSHTFQGEGGGGDGSKRGGDVKHEVKMGRNHKKPGEREKGDLESLYEMLHCKRKRGKGGNLRKLPKAAWFFRGDSEKS